MNLNKTTKDRIQTIAVIGLGYVGMPLAVAFAENGQRVVGFDVNEQKVALYNQNIDPTHEVGTQRLQQLENIIFTANEDDIKGVKYYIVAVPTPINADKTPNLKIVESASHIVGRNMTKGAIVIYESTVYPGVTEEICAPILEKESGLICGRDFKIGYSPERINPGDKEHTVEKIIKVVSGMDDESLEGIAQLYETIITAGVHRASSIKVAEAAKVIENSQRDINIAFVNELAIIFDKMGINTREVLQAAGTKWNFLNFTPGLVGGHCIGVDPYYLTHRAKELGYNPEVILAGREINDDMGKYIAQTLIRKLVKSGANFEDIKVAILGLTFKENVPDLRNSRVIDIINELKEYDIDVLVADPVADELEAKQEYGIDLIKTNEINDVSAIIVAVGHEQYSNMTQEQLLKMYGPTNANKILIDVKAIIDENQRSEFDYWQL